jgi:hypothetical protein
MFYFNIGTISSIICSTSIAIWQIPISIDAENQFGKLNDVLFAMREQKVENTISGVLKPNYDVGGSFSDRYIVSAEDVNGDGINEILVQFPVGAHGSSLQIFGIKKGNFILLADYSVGTPSGFWFVDFNDDGRLEIATKETDFSLKLSYENSLREIIYLKLEDDKLIEIIRVKDYSDKEKKEALTKYGHKN